MGRWATFQKHTLSHFICFRLFLQPPANFASPAPSAGEGYLVCTGSPRRVGDILDLLLGMIRVKVRVERDPALVRPSDPPYGKASYARLEADTGWRPEIPFEQTVRDTLDYWRRSLSRKAV